MDKGNQERKSELGEVVKMKDSKILDLQFVVMDDIVFKNIPFEDRINTKLTLSDYDWMNYVFETEFRTKNQGRLKVEIKYYGSKESEMNVKRIDTIGVFEYTYFFETEMFEEYVSRFELSCGNNFATTSGVEREAQTISRQFSLPCPIQW